MWYSIHMNNTNTINAAYDKALEVFRKASKKFGEAQTAYRTRTIGDAAFIAAREEFKAAEVALDAAEAEVVNA